MVLKYPIGSPVLIKREEYKEINCACSNCGRVGLLDGIRRYAPGSPVSEVSLFANLRGDKREGVILMQYHPASVILPRTLRTRSLLLDPSASISDDTSPLGKSGRVILHWSTSRRDTEHASVT